MKKLKIALVQIHYRPAIILESHKLLVEPIFTSEREPHTSISMMSFNGAEKISNNLLKNYLSWLRSKVVAVIDKCINLKVDLLVFPEYSIPFDLLNDICALTKDNNISIVAGTHMITKTPQQLPQGYPEIKDCLKYAMAPVIKNGRIEHYTFKKILTAPEYNNIKVPKEDVIDDFEDENAK